MSWNELHERGMELLHSALNFIWLKVATAVAGTAVLADLAISQKDAVAEVNTSKGLQAIAVTALLTGLALFLRHMKAESEFNRRERRDTQLMFQESLERQHQRCAEEHALVQDQQREEITRILELKRDEIARIVDFHKGKQ